MKASTIAKKDDPRVSRTRDAAGWLGLAAAPTFALMAWLSATDPPHNGMCASAPGGLALDAMSWMYLLMSLFHASPWLKLRPARRLTRPTRKPEGD
ncbi:MAG: hypothetical protein JXB36_06760 [Gammaproteobacteria bacterium]|nr:hypothetical protein [Gammaproteobacteria bacterium]